MAWLVRRLPKWRISVGWRRRTARVAIDKNLPWSPSQNESRRPEAGRNPIEQWPARNGRTATKMRKRRGQEMSGAASGRKQSRAGNLFPTAVSKAVSKAGHALSRKPAPPHTNEHRKPKAVLRRAIQPAIDTFQPSDSTTRNPTSRAPRDMPSRMKSRTCTGRGAPRVQRHQR